jgi:hypothetical protein
VEALAEGGQIASSATTALALIGDRRGRLALQAAYARCKEICAGPCTSFSENDRVRLLEVLVRIRDKAELDDWLVNGDIVERLFAQWEVSARETERQLQHLVGQGTDLAVAVRTLYAEGGDGREQWLGLPVPIMSGTDKERWLGRAVANITGAGEEECFLLVLSLCEQRK